MKQNRWCIAGVFWFSLLLGCTNRQFPRTEDSTLSVPPAVLLPSTAATDAQTLRFLQDRIKADPDDFIAQNKLAAWHLQRVRETGDLASLEIAMKAALASLATLPAEHNTGALTLLAQAEFTAHDFIASRKHAERLIELEPGKGYPFEILGDALLEIGEYERAETAFREFEQSGGIQGLTRVAIEQRMSRLALLRGDEETAERRMLNALKTALSLPVPPRETVAWCRWQRWAGWAPPAAICRTRSPSTNTPQTSSPPLLLSRLSAISTNASAGMTMPKSSISCSKRSARLAFIAGSRRSSTPTTTASLKRPIRSR